MIAECAVEPEVMARWEHFHSLHGDFGVGQGKLICEFSESWIRSVLHHAAEFERQGINSPLQAQKLLDQFDPHNKGSFLRAIVPSTREFPHGANWCDAARSTQPEFDLIVHSLDPLSANELKAGEFVKNSGPFVTYRQTEVPRTADALIDCGWECYRRAKEIYVVDPYFRPLDQTFGLVLGKFLARLERCGSRPSRIEIHTKLPDVYKRDIQQSNWNYWAESHLPSNWHLKVVHWEQLETGSKMHARYILTDFGGLDYNWGTDEDPKEYTQVGLLDDRFWEKLYKRFAWPEKLIPDVFLNYPGRIIEVIG